MQKYIIMILSLWIISCGNQTKNNKILDPVITDSLLYKKDIKQIEECYLSNVEYYRTHPDSIDEGTIFNSFGIYYDDNLGYVKLPTHTKENIEVKVGAIYYKPNSLIAVIFIGVKELKQPDNEGQEYHAVCAIGLRNAVDQNFILYPLSMYKQAFYSNYDDALSSIRFRYFNDIADTHSMWGKKYRTNMGDKDFWTNNLLWDKVVTSESFQYHTSNFPSGEKLYKFQTYSVSDMDGEHWNNHYKYNVVDCSNNSLGDE